MDITDEANTNSKKLLTTDKDANSVERDNYSKEPTSQGQAFNFYYHSANDNNTSNKSLKSLKSAKHSIQELPPPKQETP
jgi:uridine kinase